jgi:hypothetical protein
MVVISRDEKPFTTHNFMPRENVDGVSGRLNSGNDAERSLAYLWLELFGLTGDIQLSIDAYLFYLRQQTRTQSIFAYRLLL